ncbi:efflux RND transporter periplasmic adaptor subunit [Victivallis sp. Marseille-Q1083]|uniref:efflux RND transporter periplasmic adaptor subunit n=1 Tax=Victivallis sp. Marseille-Q1083 TaxID=2717288 RepID=UPI001589705F|nr:efflux RND transporter periplasmic adaptor subunit [Victivallis sp. Marseille-Q1083]
MNKAKIKKYLLPVVVLLLVGGGIYGYWLWRGMQKALDAAATDAQNSSGVVDRTYVVKRGDLTLGLTLSGTVNAREKYRLSLQANFNTKLLSVVDENSIVKKGDVLAEFETDTLKERIDDLKIELENLEKDLLVEKEAERILVSSNEAALRSAQDRVVQAEDALRKYRKFERAEQRDSLELAIQNAETKAKEAKDSYDTRQVEIMQAGSVDKEVEAANEKELRNLEDALATAQNSLDKAETNRKVFKRYDHPTKLKTLVNTLDQAVLDLEKTQVSNEANLMQKKRSIDNLKVQIRRKTSDLERHNSYLEQMKLVAPVDGVVIYGDPDRRWGNEDIKTGMDVYKGRVLMTIPDMGNLLVDFDLPEQFRAKVNVKDKVVITPDSLPGIKAPGSIESIDTLPVPLIIWDAASPKIYKSRVVLDEQNPALVNGMSVQVDVVTKVIPQTLFVPVEAVFEDKDRYFVYKYVSGSPVEADVKIGESNNNFVQITEGIEEGDIVYLYRPYQKKQE